MGRRKRLLIDLDDTLSDLVSKWLSVYNEEFNDNLCKEDIKSWEIVSYVKPEAVEKFFKYLQEPTFFESVDVKPYAQEVTERLVKRYELFVVTAYCPEACLAKCKWLRNNFPHIPEQNIVFCRDKGIIKADFMIDDGIHNIEDFKKTNPHGLPIVFDAPWNRYVGGKYIRAKDWIEVEEWFIELENQL